MADQQYDDELRGALFKNKDKVSGDTRPEYKGYVQVQGVRYELASWLRTAKSSGQKFMSLKLELPQASQGAAPAPQQTRPVQAAPVAPPPDPDDSIPF